MKYLFVYIMLCLFFIFFMAHINANSNSSNNNSSNNNSSNNNSSNNIYEMNNLVILPNPKPTSLVQH